MMRDDGEVEQRQVETSTARGNQRPRAARRPETSVLGDGARQVVWTVVTGLDLQLADMLTRRKYRSCLYYSAPQSHANRELTWLEVKGQGQNVNKIVQCTTIANRQPHELQLGRYVNLTQQRQTSEVRRSYIKAKRFQQSNAILKFQRRLRLRCY